MDNELFNDKTIKKLCSAVKVNQKQKKNADEWIRLLESESLIKERENYFNFAEYILKDILGYPIKKELGHEISNIDFTFSDSNKNHVLCIEAKGQKTNLFTRQYGRDKKEQETPIKQTWDNMGRLSTFKYGICTNYRHFILLDRSKGYSKYYLFDFLSIKNQPEKLKEFIAIFSKESIIEKEFIEILYEKSIIEEREFTKQFYKLFHETRLMLIKEFQDNGASRDESIHFAQIFLNRLMFVFFAEDTGKLKQRLFEDMVLNLLKVDSVFSEKSHMICNLIKSIFENLNEGSERHKIFGFNGGLFREKIPERIYFRDFRKKEYFNEIYQHSTLKKEISLDEHSNSIIEIYNGNINPITLNMLYMASFDFNTEVSVNILGHIFEQSISDLEELKDEKVLRRKKEGVFYTPDFITDYICRNTIIPHLSKKGVNTVDKLIDEYSDNIDDLEEKFRNLKILDPACGSGSFLLKAVEVLLEVHKEVQTFKQKVGEYTAKKKTSMKRWQKRGVKGESQLTLIKWNEEDEAREIIENNIYGVDINEESVEITKLSLFFKIARKNKKLIDLSNNIKCGNALIDNSEFSEEKIFDWKKEFKPIMDKGGFDIIVGNPPYIRVEFIPEHLAKYYKKRYKNSSTGKFDISSLFIERSIELLNDDGKYSIISSYQFIYSSSGIGLRNYLIDNVSTEIIKFSTAEQIFDGATTYPGIFIFTKRKRNRIVLKEANSSNQNISITKSFNIDNENFTSEKVIVSDLTIYNKIIKKTNITKGHEIGTAKCGVVSSADDVFFITKNIVDDLDLEKDLIYQILGPDELFKWYLASPETYCIYPYHQDDNKTKLIDMEKIKITYPNIFQYLLKNERRLKSRSQGRKDYSESSKWYQLNRPREKWIYDSKKIIYPGTTNSPKFALDEKRQLFRNARVYSFVLKNENVDLYKYLLCILNSELCHYMITIKCPPKSNNYYEMSTNFLDDFPFIISNNKTQKPFIEKANFLIKINKQFYESKEKFLRRLSNNLNLKKYTKKLIDFYELYFNEFINELKKQKIILSLKQQDEWEDYFNTYKKELNMLQKQMCEAEKEIDQMVYNLYGITKDEIKIIENSLKNS